MKTKVSNTADFQKAITEGRLDEAEEWLLKIREEWNKYVRDSKTNTRPKRDDSAISSRERTLMNAYITREDWAGAKRIIENSVHPENVKPRAQKLENVSGKRYEDI